SGHTPKPNGAGHLHSEALDGRSDLNPNTSVEPPDTPRLRVLNAGVEVGRQRRGTNWRNSSSPDCITTTLDSGISFQASARSASGSDTTVWTSSETLWIRGSFGYCSLMARASVP